MLRHGLETLFDHGGGTVVVGKNDGTSQVTSYETKGESLERDACSFPLKLKCPILHA